MSGTGTGLAPLKLSPATPIATAVRVAPAPGGDAGLVRFLSLRSAIETPGVTGTR